MFLCIIGLQQYVINPSEKFELQLNTPAPRHTNTDM
jgi:hypothetical protein